MTLTPGTVVCDRYRIVGLMAEGGMSTVYEVEDQRLPGRLVLKEMRDLSTDPDIQAQIHAQFDREAQTLARLTHRYLPRVIDCFYWNERRYLVEDLVLGRTLEAVLEERSPQDAAEVVRWAGQICEALQALHEQHLVYRDLKPSNVMITPDGSIRLIDFGIVRSFALAKSRDTVVMGTPGFAAPEQYGTQQTDPRSDIYSLGVLMHHLLTGYDPAEQPFTLPPVRDLNPLVEERLATLIATALEIRPEKRFPSAESMRGALEGRPDVGTTTEKFTWSGTEITATSAAMAGCAAMTVLSLLECHATPFAGALGMFLSPFFMWLLAFCRRQQMWLSTSAVQLDASGVTLQTLQGAPSFMAWTEIESLEYAIRGLERRTWLQLRGRRRQLRIPIGAAQVLNHLLHFPALAGSDRLGELILEKARLRPEAGSARWVAP